MNEPRQPENPENVGGCPECGYYGSRTYTEWEDGQAYSVTECLKCGHQEWGWVDENGNTRYEESETE